MNESEGESGIQRAEPIAMGSHSQTLELSSNPRHGNLYLVGFQNCDELETLEYL